MSIYYYRLIYVGLEVVVKAKKLTKAAMAKKIEPSWLKHTKTVRNKRKGRWVIIRKTKKGKREGNGIGLKQKNEKRDF